MKINRRNLLVGLGSLSILTLVGYRKIKSSIQTKVFPGRIQGASFSRGHLIRKPEFPPAAQMEKVSTLIVGAGVSGLSAAYHLHKENHDFLILDLEQSYGGNARSGQNSSGQYPQGAHYLPLPPEDAIELKDFLADIGVITSFNNDGVPTYNDYYLCSDPLERLYINGRWQEGIEPYSGLQDFEKEEMDRFFKLIDSFRHLKGKDGKKAFTLPRQRSSQDPKITKLDQIDFQSFIKSKNFQLKYLFWYLDYCCLDDYGAKARDVSAWAGIHYFVSRVSKVQGIKENHNRVLTWPEGNQFLVSRLASPVKEKIRLNNLVFSITDNSNGFEVLTYDFKEKKTIKYQCEKLIYSAPSFTAEKVFQTESLKNLLLKKEYSPWMVANIELTKRPLSGKVPLSWDNVSYYGKSLGHVVSDHQTLSSMKTSLTLTQYWPLMASGDSSKIARIKALKTTHQEWCEEVVKELEQLYPGIADDIKKIDISLFGHGMIIPKPGFLKSKKVDHPNLFMAHTDQAGLSLFEEGFYQGLEAAKDILNAG